MARVALEDGVGGKDTDGVDGFAICFSEIHDGLLVCCLRKRRECL